MHLKAIIIDDERLARNELRKLLANFPEIEVIDEASNAAEALQKIETENPDVIFLDIQMPGKSGFELLAELDSVPSVIFTTAYDEYALKAFEVNALDYLLKPIEPKRLADAIYKISHEKNNDKESSNSSTRNTLTENHHVFVKNGERCWFVKLADIRLFESVGNYAKVYFGNNKPLILKSLNALEERLDECMFFRANRKHIINLHWVEKIETSFNDRLQVFLQGGEVIEVSRRQTALFKDIMSL